MLSTRNHSHEVHTSLRMYTSLTVSADGVGKAAGEQESDELHKT